MLYMHPQPNPAQRFDSRLPFRRSTQPGLCLLSIVYCERGVNTFYRFSLSATNEPGQDGPWDGGIDTETIQVLSL